jgi:hypothetical protein
MNNKRVETRWKRRYEKKQLRKEIDKEMEEGRLIVKILSQYPERKDE